MKNRIVKVMMISVTMMMMVTGCKDTTKNSGRSFNAVYSSSS